jgi:hypothetical protein
VPSIERHAIIIVVHKSLSAGFLSPHDDVEGDAVIAHHFPDDGPALPHARHDAGEKLVRITAERAGRLAVLEKVVKRQAAQAFGALAHQLAVTLVEQHDTALGIEHAKPVSHIVERNVELTFLFVDDFLRLLVRFKKPLALRDVFERFVDDAHEAPRHCYGL